MTAANVPRALAQARAARIADLTYALRLDLSNRERSIRGSITASFDLRSAGDPLEFDFVPPLAWVEGVSVNGHVHPVEPGSEDGRVLIAAAHLRRGRNSVGFEFRAGSTAIHARDDLVYSLFVPARAATAFPCFDQPDLKARWTLTLHVPEGWSAVSNGREAGRTPARHGAIVAFEETARLPPYLFAFAAGRFEIDEGERHGRRIRMFHRESEPTRVRENREILMDLHAHALSWLEDYTGIPYPFGKFDFVVIPSFQFSGMEHPGAVFYNASSVLLDGGATHAQQLARANVVAHEVAHMWFGNLVTMTWFDDVWLKEVFAGFLADKIVNPVFPGLQHDLRFFWEHYPAAYDVDRSHGSHPIRQSLDNLRDAGSLYGPVIYQKAPIVMRQLEDRLGADTLRRALQDYLATHAMGHAAWPDLLDALMRHSDTPLLKPWSSAWIERAGRPAIAVDLSTEDGRIGRLRVRQAVAGAMPWPQDVHLLLGYESETRHAHLDLTGPQGAIHEAVGWPLPAWILPGGPRPAYGRFDPDTRTIEFLLRSLSTLSDPFVRGVAWLTLWEAMLEGRAPVRAVWAQLLAALRDEPDPLNLQQLLKYVSTLYWHIFSPVTGKASAGAIETVLRNGLADASGASAKTAWFGALRSLAATPDTLEWLHRVWSRDACVDGLTLSEQDEMDLAVDLALRAGPIARDVLPRQRARIEHADRLGRFDFISPALSSDPAVRDEFFGRLRSRPGGVPETWILDGLRLLLHPWRTPSGGQIVTALRSVRETYDAGDIFFGRRWIEAAMAGCQPVSAVEAVQQFLQELPADYPPRLRLMLLAAADVPQRMLATDRPL
jgi:aminopeptidase N